MMLRRCTSLSAGLLALALSACGGSAGSGNTNDSPQLTLSFSNTAPTLPEGDSGQSQLTLTLTLSAAADRDYVVDYSVAEHTAGSAPASAGTDFVAANGSLTVLQGATSAALTVLANGDELVEANETFLVSASQADLGSGQVVVTILDDDRPSLSIADAALTEGDSGVKGLEFTVTMTPAVASESVTVDYATADGTALDGVDYDSSRGTLTFAPGATTQTLSVPVRGDTLVESNEGFSVALSNVSANARIARGTAAGSITDNDLVGVSVRDVSRSEGNSGSSPFSFEVELSQEIGEAVEVSYSTQGGSATEGVDYVAASGSLTIAAGQSSAEIVVDVRGDGDVEPDEQFSVELTAVSSNAKLLDASAIGTILNDDSDDPDAPQLSAIGTLSVSAGASSSVALSASDADGDALTFSASLPAFASLSDNGDGTGSLNLNPTLADLGSHSATVTVSDGGLDDSETFTIEVVTADVILSELMASNASTLADGDGAFEDWIELHNRGGASADLTGWCLSDDATNPAMWCFPATELKPGAYLIVFASKKASSALTGELHAGLKLSKSGEFLALYKPDGTLVSQFEPSFPQQGTDISWGRDALGDLRYFSQPTPGAANGEGSVDVLQLGSTQLSMSALTGNQASPLEVSLKALSDGALAYSLSVDDGGNGWLSAQAIAGDDGLTPDTLLISASAASLAGGSYSGTVTASAAGSGSATLTVNFTVAGDGGTSADVEISEFMAANLATLADGDGDFEDWIELHNRGATAVNLAGWCLTDDSAKPQQWCFPAQQLAADGYLTVFASGKSGSAKAGELHASLRLGQGGEYLGLIKPNGDIASEFAPSFPEQAEDVSYGRDVVGALRYFSSPTPGAANGAGVEDVLRFATNPLVIAANAGDAGSPLQLALNSIAGATAAYSLSVDDGGLGWLTASTASGGNGSTVDNIELLANASALSAGSYSATVTATAAGLGSAVLRVTFNISAVDGSQPDVVISEFMASNISTLADVSGVFEDWIELHNRSNMAVDLTGWCLTDSAAQPKLWCFDDGPQLAAGAHQLVFASDKAAGNAARAVTQALANEYHAGLKLAQGGEYLALMRPDGSIASQFAPAYPAQFDDVSYGEDVAGQRGFFRTPTPAAANAASLNQAPVLQAVAAQTLSSGSSTQLALSASDADGDALSFSLSGQPGFVTLSDQGDGSASLSLSPLAADQGVHSFQLSVSDGLLNSVQTISVTVNVPANSAPVLAAIGDVAVTAGQSLTVAVHATDANGDALTLSASGLPDWARLNDLGTGLAELVMTPAAGDTGAAATVVISASDGQLSSSQTVQLQASDSATPSYHLVYSLTRDRAGTLRLDGASISAGLFARIAPQNDISAVDFFLDGAATAFRNEQRAPYELAGGTSSAADPWDTTQLADGSHSIRSVISLKSGGEVVLNSTFNVLNNQALVLSAIGHQTLQFEQTLNLVLSASSAQGKALNFSLSGPAFANLSDNDDGTASLQLAPLPEHLGDHALTVTVTDGLLSAAETLTVSVVAPPEVVVINEFMASNTNTLLDVEGASSDWIELHNRGTERMDLGGWCLTDDATLPAKWCFEAGTLIDAGGFLTVFASNPEIAPAGELHAAFKLSEQGEYLALFKPDGQPSSELAPEYPPQASDISYGLNSAGEWVYFSSPTPAAANGEGTTKIPARANFSHQRGFYDSAFQLAVSTGGGIDALRYTTDGSVPDDANGQTYAGPIAIDTTTVVRVQAYAGGLPKGPVLSHSYLFLADVIRQPANIDGYPNTEYSNGSRILAHDYAMDPAVVDDPLYSGSMITAMRAIPSISLSLPLDDLFGAEGFHDNDEVEKEVSMEILYPERPADNQQLNTGIESHSHLRHKRSMRLNFRDKYGAAKLESDLFSEAVHGADTASGQYDKLILRGGNNRCWCRAFNPATTTYTIDQFYRDTQLAASGDASRGVYAHLYINGLYWGLYNVAERPDKHFLSDYFGGGAEHWFSANHGVVHSKSPPLSGDAARYTHLTTELIHRDLSLPENYAEFVQYVDVDRFIDYLLVSWWAGTQDWPDNNWYAGHRNDTSAKGLSGLMFFAWDGEWSWDVSADFDNPNNRAIIHPKFRADQTVDSAGGKFMIAQLWHAARQNADFMARVDARFEALTDSGGALNDAVAQTRWLALNAHIRDAVIAESARWGDMGSSVTRTRDDDWQPEVDKIHGLISGNAAELRSQLESEGFLQ